MKSPLFFGALDLPLAVVVAWVLFRQVGASLAGEPAPMLQWLLLALGVGAVGLFPSLRHLLCVFKQQGLFSHIDPPPNDERQPEGHHT